MPREIKSETDQGSTTNYRDRLLKLIPSEIVAAYVTLHGLIMGLESDYKYNILWIVVGVLFVLTPFYLIRVSMVTKKGQILITSIGFLVWVFTTNPPIDKIWDIPSIFIGSLIFILYTLFIPLFYKG